MAQSLTGKVVIITGGANGVGAATVSKLRDLGARVASLDVLGQDSVDDDSRLNIKCDISSEDECKAAVGQVLAKWNDIDILVNCAAMMDSFQRTSDCPSALWSKILSVNLNGPFFLSKYTIQHFLTKPGPAKGSIVNISSTAGIKGADAGVAYTASKHGLIGLTKSTAWMYAKEGIRCNALIPGGIKTDILKNSNSTFDPVGSAALRPVHDTMPGWVTPDEVADSVIYLATAACINGAQLTIDHGWTVG